MNWVFLCAQLSIQKLDILELLFDHLSLNSWDLLGVLYNQAPPLLLSACGAKLTHRGGSLDGSRYRAKSGGQSLASKQQ